MTFRDRASLNEFFGVQNVTNRWLHHGGLDTPRSDELKDVLASLHR